MLEVTKTFLPEIDEFETYLKKIWARNRVTNDGPLVQELEKRLSEFFNMPNVIVVSSGTIALQFAIRALKLHGKIITTPFSFVATTSSIVWQGCVPEFVDIEPDHLTIDPDRISNAITTEASAVIPTHVFGNPCDTEKIDHIAHKNKIPIIYDAAHAFGVTYNGKSIAQYGTISVFSFHASKIFHTIEGGALVTHDNELARRIRLMRNFGLTSPNEYEGVGINGKVSEMHAAMGLCILPKMESLISKRRIVSGYYDGAFNTNTIKKVSVRQGTDYNFSYYPVLFENEKELLHKKKTLNDRDIHPRRYFYPALNTLPFVVKTTMPVAEDIAKRILCLPLHHEMNETDVKQITDIINS